MEEGSQSTGYWCYECSRAVETIMEVETVKCSLCHGGFVEEFDISRNDNHDHDHHHHHHAAGESEADNALSLWAPILLGIMSHPRRSNRGRRFRQIESNNENRDRNGSELNRELRSVMRRRRRSSTTVLQLLQGTRAALLAESDDNDNDNNNNINDNNNNDNDDDNDRERDGERVIVINPYNQRIIVQGTGSGRNPFNSGGPSPNQPPGALGDYFIGPDMELLLQHLAENSTARYGTPPAQKKAVETMLTMIIIQDLNNSIPCSVCLEDFEVGNEAKEMPCKHRFHGECIVTWLDLHSTCPVCRYQLPCDESKLKRERERARGTAVNRLTESGESAQESGTRGARQFSVTFPWPFNSLFNPTSGSQITNTHMIINPSSTAEPGSGSGPTGQESGDGTNDDH